MHSAVFCYTRFLRKHLLGVPRVSMQATFLGLICCTPGLSCTASSGCSSHLSTAIRVLIDTNCLRTQRRMSRQQALTHLFSTLLFLCVCGNVRQMGLQESVTKGSPLRAAAPDASLQEVKWLYLWHMRGCILSFSFSRAPNRTRQLGLQRSRLESKCACQGRHELSISSPAGRGGLWWRLGCKANICQECATVFKCCHLIEASESYSLTEVFECHVATF